MRRFGSFEFDSAARRLTEGGQPVHLTPKAFDFLSLLIEAAPRVVSKDEIHSRLWPSQIVSDATLIGLVKEVRRAISDNRPDRRLIRTVHRVGYAFDALLEASGDEENPSGLLVIERRRARLVAGENVVGRDPACDVWIDDMTVSRQHARIVVGPGCLALEDLGSRNGTRVGDRLINERHDLHDGDRIRFGNVGAVLRDTPSVQPTATQLDMAD